jgi:cell division initiation protein
MRENATLRERLASLEIQLLDLKKREGVLNQTLMKAQQLVEEMKQGAQKEASLIVKQAELQADEVLRGAREESSKVRNEILDLQKQRVFFLDRCRSAIESFQKMIELESQEERVERESP